jgi:heptosyltransferase-2
VSSEEFHNIRTGEYDGSGPRGQIRMKILLIRFSSLGDCILLGPLVPYLKTAGVEEVTIVTKDVYAPLLAAVDGVDRVVGYDPATGLRGLRQIADRFRDGGYTVVDAHSNLRSRLLSRSLGGARARFHKHYLERISLILFKRQVSLPSILEQYASLAGAVGLPPAKLSPGGFNLPAQIRETAALRMNKDDRPWIAIAPGSRWPTKRWPVTKYAELAERLAVTRGYRILLVGDEDDRRFTSVILSQAGDGCLDIAGETGLLESAGYLSLCRGLVGNDSGLTHLAEAVGTPVVALFGPTVESFGYYPSLESSRVVERKLACRPCSRNGSRPCIRGNQECLAEIDVDTVESAFLEMISNTGPRRIVV